MLTNWGYEIMSADALPNLLSIAEFDELTAGKYRGDARTVANIHAAQDSIRNYCGWHIAGPLSCRVVLTPQDKWISFNRGDVLVQLPARFVSAISHVYVNATATEGVWTGREPDYYLDPNGLVRLYDVGYLPRKSRIVIEYTAGLSAEMCSGIKELVAHRVTHALASSAGVQSETAGNVSITYSANWINSARATALADDNKEMLAPYRVVGVL